MVSGKNYFFIVFFLFLLVIPVVSAFDFSTASYDVGSFHMGVAGGESNTSSYEARSTLTYEQGGNKDGNTTSYSFNSGWFGVTEEEVGNVSINSVRCSNNTVDYFACTSMSYGMNITHIEVNCTANSGTVDDVRYNLFNTEDNTSYINNVSYTYSQGDLFVLNSSYFLQDSGNWNLTVTCIGANSTITDERAWNLPFGLLNVTLIQPVANISVQIFQFFTFQSQIECIGGECGTVNATLDPQHCEDLVTCTNETVEICEDTVEEICADICTELCINVTLNDTNLTEQQCSQSCTPSCTNQTVNVCTNSSQEICSTEEVCTLEEEQISQEDIFSGFTYSDGETITSQSKQLGTKIEDEIEYETHFMNITKTNAHLYLKFYHDHNESLAVWIEGNVIYNLSKENAEPYENVDLFIELVNGIVPRFDLHIGNQSEVFSFGKTIPDFDIDEEVFVLEDRDDSKLNANISKGNELIEIKGLENVIQIVADINDDNNSFTTTNVAAVQSVNIEQATISLEKKGDVNVILSCDDSYFNYGSLECSSWNDTNIAFTEENNMITFTVDHFTAYAGGNISKNQTGYLTIWDENDAGMPNASQQKTTNQNIIFFADYKVSQNGSSINDGNCSISFNDLNASMSYNSSYSYYLYNRSFSNSLLYTYSVTCTHSSYSNLTSSDSISVASSINKTGAVSTTVGDTPFYTTSSNPQSCSILRAGDTCVSTWLVNATGLLDTTHTFFTIYNMTSNRAYVNDTESVHLQITITANDTQPPTIISTSALPSIVIPGEDVHIFATSSDNVQVGSCYVNITLPNSSIVQRTNVCGIQQIYTAEILGRHNLTFVANDTSNNIATDSSDYFEVVSPINFSVTTNQSNGSVQTELTMIYPPTGEIIRINETNGQYTTTVPETVYDLQFKAFTERLQVTIRNVNISIDNNKTFGMDKLSTPVSGYLATYGLNNNYSFSNATIRVYYDDLAFSVESNLRLNKCADWNFTEQICFGTWEDVTGDSSQNTASDYFDYITTSFSGFSIEEIVSAAPSAGGGGGIAAPIIIEEEICTYDFECAVNQVCSDGKCVEKAEEVTIEGSKVVLEEEPEASSIAKVLQEPKLEIIPVPSCELFGIDLGKIIICWYWWILLGLVILLLSTVVELYQKYKQLHLDEFERRALLNKLRKDIKNV